MNQTDSATYIRSTVSEYENRIETLDLELRLLRQAVVALRELVEGRHAEAGLSEKGPKHEDRSKEAEEGRMLIGQEVAIEATDILKTHGSRMTIAQIWTALGEKRLRYTNKDAARTMLQYHIERRTCPVVKERDETTNTVLFRYVGEDTYSGEKETAPGDSGGGKEDHARQAPAVATTDSP